ncbi:hypothetical protein JTE90_018346 [Oedothorax gibbosus]|uniref:C2H2-type domain-containing protein n=1 Tax=Oedothorax gibbosus TaxID=931172 RepID=A0AAV6U1B9_9ARAC|nr:hypothetical protein JTE90_018346 [Oedothorax gibbosus]
MITDEANMNDELEKNEAMEDESIFLDTNKRKRVPEVTHGYQYQPAEPEIPNGVEVDEFTCPYCLKAFPKVLNKKTHMRVVHNVSFRSKGRSKGFIKCNECDIEFLLVNKLRQHLREVHGMAMTQEIHRFPNMEDMETKTVRHIPSEALPALCTVAG